MKYKKNLFILGIILVVFLLIYFFFFRGVSLVWNTYKNPKVSFSFKYPSNWFICEEFYPNSEKYFVHITDKDVACTRGELNTTGQIDITIGDYNVKTSEKDIQVYLNNAEKEFNAEEEKNIKAGRLPTAPGFTWGFDNYAGRLFALDNSTAAKVGGDFQSFVLLSKEKIYEVMINSKAGLDNLPTRILFYTIRAN